MLTPDCSALVASNTSEWCALCFMRIVPESERVPFEALIQLHDGGRFCLCWKGKK